MMDNFKITEKNPVIKDTTLYFYPDIDVHLLVQSSVNYGI
jgi:hypothetical protein